MKNLSKNSGFTIVELLIVIGVFLSIITLAWTNVSNLPSQITLSTTHQNILSDLKNQQSYAMNGEDLYGIYFGNNTYTLFKGASYNANDPNNFTINLENANFVISTTFSSQVVIFNSSSGEINNFLENNNSITITDNLTGNTKTLILNKYGVSI